MATQQALTAPRRPDLWTFAAFVVFVVVGLEAIAISTILIPGSDIWSLGMDYRYYRDVGAAWLADGSYYLPHQLSGPYVVQLMVDVLYPPPALLLFVPFAFLPAVLWWAVPILVLGYALFRLRPAPWAWLGIAILFAWPRSIGVYLFGNTDIWAVAAAAGGIVWGWPAALLVLKPVLLPFAYPALRRPAFGVGLMGVMAISLLMLPLWTDYITAMRGLIIDPAAPLGTIPLMLIPIVAWLGRSRRDRPVTSDPLQRDDAGGSIQVAADRP